MYKKILMVLLLVSISQTYSVQLSNIKIMPSKIVNFVKNKPLITVNILLLAGAVICFAYAGKLYCDRKAVERLIPGFSHHVNKFTLIKYMLNAKASICLGDYQESFFLKTEKLYEQINDKQFSEQLLKLYQKECNFIVGGILQSALLLGIFVAQPKMIADKNNS